MATRKIATFIALALLVGILGMGINLSNVAASGLPKMFVDTVPSTGSGYIVDQTLRPGLIPITTGSNITTHPTNGTSGYGYVSSYPSANAYNGTWTNQGNAYDKSLTTTAVGWGNSSTGTTPFKSFRCFGTGDGTNGSVTNPGYAHDKSWALSSAAKYSFSQSPTYFDVTPFNDTVTTTRPLLLNLYVEYNVTVYQYDPSNPWNQYRISLFVGSNKAVLLDWISVNSTGTETIAFNSIADPSGTAWTQSDIQNIKIRIESTKVSSSGSPKNGFMYITEEWLVGGEIGYSYLELTTWNATGTYTFSTLNFKMRYNTTAFNGSSWRIIFYVGSNINVLRDWNSTNMAISYYDDVFTNVTDPNGGGKWSLTDISNIRFRVELRKESPKATGVFKWIEMAAYADVSLWGNNNFVTNPGNAYDGSSATYTGLDMSQNSYLTGWAQPTGYSFYQVGLFNTSIAKAYNVLEININLDFSASFTNEHYRILLQVGKSLYGLIASPTTWSTIQYTTHYVHAYLNKPEPNDGNWNWSDIASMRIRVETQKTAASGTGTFNFYECWATLLINRVVVGISVQNVADLYSWQFTINYTATVLNITQLSNGGYTAVREGAFYTSGGTTSLSVHVHSNYTLVADTFVGAKTGVNGNGTLACIEFQVKAYGCTKLVLWGIGGANSGGQTITWTSSNGWFDNRIPGDITGSAGAGKYDGVVNTYDSAYAGGVFGSSNAIADFTGPNGHPDGVVNTFDTAAIGGNFGKHYP